VKLLLSTKTWEEVALIVGCDRDYLLKAAKTLTIDERQFLVKSLTDYLRREPDGLNQVSWVSKNLLEKALSKLSFILKKIGGPDNLVDEPKIEYVHGCCFVSLQKFGTKYEQWLFQKDGKLFPVFGRDEFIIEKF
jgi:predicted metalloendopeptidase